MDKDYSKRELDHMFADIQGSLNRIEEQTTRHNSRMTKMEAWRNYISGAVSILGVVVLPILGWALYTLSNIDGHVHDMISVALAAYQSKP